MTDLNVFEAFAESQMSNAKKREYRREETKAAKKTATPPMVLQGLEKKQAEKAKQMIRYRLWKTQVRDGITRGDYGTEIIGLFKLLRSRIDEEALVEFVRNADWLHRCSLDVRWTLLGYISHAMILYRIRSGFPPMDDPIPSFDGTPDPPLNAFLMIKQVLGV